jgi:hypothetical protein
MTIVFVHGVPVTVLEAAMARPDLVRILSLYRSMPGNTLAERGRDLAAAAARPGLVPVATNDDTGGSTALRHRAAQRAGARAVDLDGLGHWWILEDPARAARMLTDFWAGR